MINVLMINNVITANVFHHVYWVILVHQLQSVTVIITELRANVHRVTLEIHLRNVKELNVHMTWIVQQIECASTSIVSIRVQNTALRVLQTPSALSETTPQRVDVQKTSRWEIQILIVNVYHHLCLVNQNVKLMWTVPVVLHVSKKNVWIRVKKLNPVRIVLCARFWTVYQLEQWHVHVPKDGYLMKVVNADQSLFPRHLVVLPTMIARLTKHVLTDSAAILAIVVQTPNVSFKITIQFVLAWKVTMEIQTLLVE